jgi:FkbH-like protein
MSIKCVIWDLDHTLWEGVLLEGDEVRLRPGVRETLQALDSWGILHSIASHNDAGQAVKKLEAFGLTDYFLAPQINFQPKPEQINAIAQAIDLRLEDLAYVDDDAFQRAQAAALLPGLTVLDEVEGLALPRLPGIRSEELTAEARSRRRFYQSRFERDQAETAFDGSRLEFLKSCRLRLIFRRAEQDDIPRVYELIQRTNQLNATAQRFSLEQVLDWMSGSEHVVWVGQLTDRFGDYGMVAAAVVQRQPSPWLLKVILVSCRAMGRGVGEGMLGSVLRRARDAGQERLHALYRKTPHNQAMRLLFTTHGFRPASGTQDGDIVTYERRLVDSLPDFPIWLEIDTWQARGF